MNQFNHRLIYNAQRVPTERCLQCELHLIKIYNLVLSGFKKTTKYRSYAHIPKVSITIYQYR